MIKYTYYIRLRLIGLSLSTTAMQLSFLYRKILKAMRPFTSETLGHRTLLRLLRLLFFKNPLFKNLIRAQELQYGSLTKNYDKSKIS